MCGRFRLSRDGKAIVEDFALEEVGLELDVTEWSARYNIAPTEHVLVIRGDERRAVRRCTRMRWGLIPYWAKSVAVAVNSINARAETAASKPVFRDSMRARRCLIPADGFYEWARLGPKQRQPYHFGMVNESTFAFAGLWDRWRDAAGREVLSCAILTTKANRLMAEVHNRMPVILHPDRYDDWLDASARNPAGLADLLLPFPAESMKKYPVSARVNSVKNDDPLCSQQIQEPHVQIQPTLFGG